MTDLKKINKIYKGFKNDPNNNPTLFMYLYYIRTKIELGKKNSTKYNCFM